MKIRAVSKTYADRTVLQMPDLELRPGEICALIGANGSGKTTFARILSGFVQADGGVKPLDPSVRVGWLPQKAYAFRMSLEENLRVAGRNPEREEELISALHLWELRGARARKLSGGETARMALARVLMNPFDLLILDEPTAAMDMESTMLAEKTVEEYCRRYQAAVLWITHNIRQAERTGKQLLFLQEGKLVEAGPCPGRLYEPETPQLRRFLDFYG